MKWIVDGKRRIEADCVSYGTDWIQFWVDGKEVAAFPAKEVGYVEPAPLHPLLYGYGKLEEVVDGSEPELLAEVRSEGEADVPTPTRPSDADAKPRKSPRKVPQHSGKVSRL